MKTQILKLFTGSVLLTLFFGCGVTKNSSSDKGVGNTRTEKVQFYDDNTYLLEKYAADSTYGYTSKNPVCVGGIKDESAIAPSRNYLNALLGPNGEKIKYFRYGSCCGFKTPNGMINDMGLLDHYGVYWKGSDTLSIYINIYDEGNLFIPLGLKSKQ
jgi:hypothetical protein